MSRVRVALCPDYTQANPYQAGLMSGLEASGVDVIPCSAEGLFPLLRAWSKVRPDVVHLHWPNRFIETERRGASFLASLLAVRTLVEVVLLRVLGVPLVWTVHNELSHERLTPRVELVYRHLLARLSVALILHCEEARERIVPRYRLPGGFRARCVVIPHGNFDPFYANPPARATARATLDLAADETVLLYFGLIRPYKRVPELIETFRSADPDARLLVVGNPWTDELGRAVEAAAKDDGRVRTDLRYVPDRAIELYFAAADGIVLPYDQVLTSGTAVLAMSFGRAVIAPDAGCLSELIGHGGGITYPASGEAGLQQALETAINDRAALRRMGERNRRVADAHTWAAVGERTSRVYRAVLDRV